MKLSKEGEAKRKRYESRKLKKVCVGVFVMLLGAALLVSAAYMFSNGKLSDNYVMILSIVGMGVIFLGALHLKKQVKIE